MLFIYFWVQFNDIWCYEAARKSDGDLVLTASMDGGPNVAGYGLRHTSAQQKIRFGVLE
jgi:hypothetical protein